MSLQDQKRVTVRLKCPNPLFEEWLNSWKEQAEARESKMQHTFSLALKSLRLYPLPLESGRDCKILKGFGDKLCKMLDEKLKEYKKTHDVGDKLSNVIPVRNNTIITDATNSKNQTSNGVTKSRNTSKQYIPQYGSGSYAILVTLYKQSLEQNYPGFLSKAEIIKHGKNFVASSFTKPDPGSRYTAWSSMRTLLSRNLVCKCSHPPKFSLTQDGEQLAKQLCENSCNEGIREKNYDEDDEIIIITENWDENRIMKTKCISVDLILNDNSKKKENFNKKGNITNTFDEFTDGLLRNTRNLEDDTFSEVKNNNRMTDNINDMKFNDKSNKININIASCPEILEIQPTEELDKDYKNFLETLDRVEYVGTSRQASKNTPFGKTLMKKSASSKDIYYQTEPILLVENGKSPFQKYPSASSIPSVKLTSNRSSKNKQGTLKRFTSTSSVTSTTSSVSVIENFIMAPNSFDIILYVDNNETSGSSNSENDEILVSLTRLSIKYEVKDLKVGDFLWICRDKTSKKELVLPCIVERKRMDDFAHSIKDKRYHEQKFRLKKSGIENLIYLVESHGNNQHTGLPLQTLHQAATNTAIQENFFVKFTENTRETVEYLANISRMLIKKYKSKTLASCLKDDIQPVNINDDLVSLMTFKELNESSVKNKRMKVTELFVKMLIQIKGMSVERALAVTQIYPTPFLLKKMYTENQGSAGEKILSGIKYGTYGKRIGAVLSKTVYQAFCRTQY